MPAIKRVNVATTTDALLGNQFKYLSRAALLTLYASCVTAGDVIGLSVGSRQFLNAGQPNIEASADVTDTDRDGMLFQERVPAGEIFVPITATTAVNFLLIIEEVG